MSRLITFGCSLTYGQGLLDCVDKNDVNTAGPKPSNLGWAATVAKELNLEIINQGNPGASNLEILYKILQFDFKEDDTVVAMWTYSFRDTHFYKKLFGGYSFRQLKRWNNPVGQMLWSPSGTEVDFAVKTWIYMNHADLFLKEKKLRYIHYPVYPAEILEHKQPFITISNLHLDGFTIIDRALDNHPGLESNKKTAEYITKALVDEQ